MWLSVTKHEKTILTKLVAVQADGFKDAGSTPAASTNFKMVYLFDIDGTLTPPLQRMEQNFLFFFLSWSKNKKVYLVGGSDKKKIESQLPSSVIKRCAGMFCCMGNEFWQGKELIYKNKFDPPKTLIEMLSSFQINTKSPTLGKAPFIEYRTGMLNFTTVGRNIGLAQRNIYYEWDKKSQERNEIAKKVEETFPNLEAKLGGQISIDIQPKGYNKSQASQWVRENIDENIFFAGDKCFEGGNDYDIYLDVKNKGGTAIQVEGWEHTVRVLSNH